MNENKNHEYSTSGITDLTNNKICIIYDNYTCPYCGEAKLKHHIETCNGDSIKVRYICNQCGFVCPVNNIIGEYKIKERPIYDSSIQKFMNNFGSKIEDRIHSIIKGGIEI